MKNLEVNKKLLQSLAKKGSSLVLVSSLLLATPNILPVSNNYVYASSSEELENLTVKVGINLYLNDKGFIPKDVNGNETYPFILNGTTYVPIRAIAELFNANISWDESSNTVSINTTGESAKLTHTPRITQALVDYNISAKKGTKLVINGVEVIPKDANGNIKDIYVANGTTYVPVRAVSEALGLPITWSDKTNSVFIGNHKTSGITVENIDDIYNFNSLLDKVYNGTQFMMLGKDDAGKWTTLGASYYTRFAVVLLDDEYYNDDLYKEIFLNNTFNLDRYGDDYNYVPDATSTFSFKEECFREIQYFGYQYQALMKADDSPFDWNKVLINQKYAEFLNKYQNVIYIGYEQNNIFNIKTMVDNYISGVDKEVYYGCNVMLDYLVVSSALEIYYNTSGIYSKTYADLYDRYEFLESELLKEQQRIYDIVFSKNLTK